MKRSLFLSLFLLLAGTAPAAAQKCPAIETSLMDRAFSELAPWRVLSGSTAECSFVTRNTSFNFGFSQTVAVSPAAALAYADELRQAVAGTSLLEPMPSLGEKGFAYQPKKDNGQVDPTSMFFFGHRGRLHVTGYLNLKEAITPAQRNLAANLIASSLGVATSPQALAKQANCRYLDPDLVKRLLPPGDVSAIVPDVNNCVWSAGGSVITVAVTKDTRGWPAAERMLKTDGCTVETIGKLGKGAGIAHHCGSGNPRAEVLVVTAGRMLRVLFAAPADPSAEQRAVLVELARFAAAK